MDNMYRAFTALICASIIGLIWLIVVLNSSINKLNHDGYAAWCKQTDNPKKLTFDEWYAMVKSMKADPSTVVMPMPMYMGR